jgi:hypothetical protein
VSDDPSIINNIQLLPVLVNQTIADIYKYMAKYITINVNHYKKDTYASYEVLNETGEYLIDEVKNIKELERDKYRKYAIMKKCLNKNLPFLFSIKAVVMISRGFEAKVYIYLMNLINSADSNITCMEEVIEHANVFMQSIEFNDKLMQVLDSVATSKYYDFFKSLPRPSKI